MVFKCLFRGLGRVPGEAGTESPVEEPRGPALEEWLLPLSRKAAQLVQDRHWAGSLRDLTLQKGLVSSLTALPLGSAGSTIYFILFPPPPWRARRLPSSPGSGINDFDVS